MFPEVSPFFSLSNFVKSAVISIFRSNETSGTAMLSFSGPTNVLNVTPPADFAMTFPLVWLPAFLVPVALLLHGLAIIKVLRRG